MKKLNTLALAATLSTSTLAAPAFMRIPAECDRDADRIGLWFDDVKTALEAE